MKAVLPASMAALMLVPATASAFTIDTDNPDVQVRWDNTVRYNVGMRTESRNQKVLNNPGIDESEMKFDRGDVVTNRVDLLSEFDFAYKENIGFRVSGAGWYDHAYRDDEVVGNPSFGAQNTYPNNRYSNFVNRFNKGPSGEILDAFVFAKFTLGDAPVGLKVGKHNIYWGESLFSLGNGIAYSQGPVDVRKALANPGSEVKELFLPAKQISLHAQLTPELSVAAQQSFEWKPWRLPDGGTYFGSADFVTLGGGTNLALAPGFAIPFNGVGGTPPDDKADRGIMAKWSPKWMDGALGVYYREFGEKLPWFVIDPAFSHAYFAYADDVKLYGLSLSKLIGEASVGAEVSYRKNTALRSVAVIGGEGARGDTWHWLINSISYFGKNAAWDSAALTAEINGSVWDKVRSNAAAFAIEGSAACPGDKWDGCVTKNNVAMAVSLVPVWYQVLPGVDVKLPLNFSVGLRGNGPTLGGNREKNGSYSVGVSAEVRQDYFFTLSYNDYLVKYKDNGNAVTTDNGDGAIYKDRGWVSFTFKTSF